MAITSKERREAARAKLEQFQAKTVPATAPESVSPKTGPGLMMAAISAIDPQISQLNEQLQERDAKVRDLSEQVASWEGDAHTKLIDSSLIVDSRWANRHEHSFSTPEFAKLKEEIESAGGNVQPIKVRAKGEKYEVVFGHRRARACRELGLPVLAMVADAMSDVTLFMEMERENRQRADLSPFEQGLMYRRALDQGLFPSNTSLAAAVGENLANLGKKLAMADLPPEVIEAFQSPLQIQLRWGGILKSAFESDPKGLVARAKAIKKEGALLKPKQVLEALLGNGSGGGSSELPLGLFTLARREDGSATIELPAGALSVEREQALSKIIADFLAKR